PIIYVRQSRDRGPLFDFAATPSVKPQFEIRSGGAPGGADDYLASTSLGDAGKDQRMPASGTGSILNTLDAASDKNFARIFRHPGLSPKADLTTPAAAVLSGSPKGAFVLISAGPDGVFFGGADGPGSSGAPIPGGDIGQMDSK